MENYEMYKKAKGEVKKVVTDAKFKHLMTYIVSQE